MHLPADPCTNSMKSWHAESKSSSETLEMHTLGRNSKSELEPRMRMLQPTSTKKGDNE